MNDSNASLSRKFSCPTNEKPEDGNKKRTKLIRLRNGHFRRIVDISNIDEKKILPNSCTFPCSTPRTEANDNKEKKWEEVPEVPSPNGYRERRNSSMSPPSYIVTVEEEKSSEQPSARTISEFSLTCTSAKDEENESVKTQPGEEEVEEEQDEDAEEEEVEEEEEAEEAEEEEEEEDFIAEKEEEKVEEKEEEKEEVPPEDKQLIAPSKTLMRGIKTNIYFLSNKEKVQALMCYNYKCNAVVFEKDTFLRYLYMKSINNIILNERMIEELCKLEELKYVLASNSIVVESTDFLKPLIIEFESSISKKIFVKHIKLNAQKEMDMKKFDEYLYELDPNEKLRLRKVERFHSFNKLVAE
ncbi:conserved Plasmodium protein, unknown function [Plasmodium ovale]|uniref:Uncharacterized protein n=1 Tax=Plasmodium ovale TaxID=36330 RepID=A0A1C3KWR6_PLAOA|nr:conserved Plasmodium protein, unknown function [Plasmodium ovale]